jgi:hypothetical protein
MEIQEADSIPNEEQAGDIDQVAVEDSPAQESSQDSESQSLRDIIKAAQDDVEGVKAGDRDEAGKFKKRADDKRESEQATKDAKAETEPESDDEGADTEQQPEIEAPQDWDKATKDAFASLPTAEAKQALLGAYKNMQAGFTRKSQEHADKVRLAEAVRNQIDDQTKARIAAEGKDEAGYISQLVGLERYARSNPVEYIKTAMQTLGVSAEHIGIAPQQQAVQEDDYSDPDIATLRQQLSGLEGSLSQQVQSQLQQFQQQQELKQWQATVDQFATAKDAEGNTLRPHFDKVRGMMASLYTAPDYQSIAEPSERLQAAYEAAVYAHPELRETAIQEQTRKAAESARQKEAVERAKRAKQPVKTSPAPATQANSKASLRDIISDVSRNVSGGQI